MIQTTKIAIFFGLILFALFSFQNKTKLEDKLNGIWIFSNYKNGLTSYTRSTKNSIRRSIASNLKNDGELIERLNISFCANGPPVYRNFKGNWEISNDSLLIIVKSDTSRAIESKNDFEITKSRI